MTLKFLCDAHKQELRLKPEKAIQCWKNTFERGQHLSNQNQWKEAIPYLGCALEAAEIILSEKTVSSEQAYELFTHSTSRLIESLKRLNQTDRIQEVYWMAIQRLTRELGYHPQAKSAISQHLETLYRNLQPPAVERDHPDLASACIHHFLRSTIH